MGYRIGGYGQTDNCSYGNAPGARGGGTGKFAGTPMTACHPDFLCFDFCSNTDPYTNKLDCIGYVEIRFRWQKSLRHGQFRTFKALPNDPLCHVARARRILLRSDTLCTPPLVTGSCLPYSRNRGRNVRQTYHHQKVSQKGPNRGIPGAQPPPRTPGTVFYVALPPHICLPSSGIGWVSPR
jgi:hypothetical protein